MPNPIELREVELIPVQLTRMEGVLNLVLERTTNLTSRMDRVEGRTSSLEAVAQRLDLEATARDRTAIALALAVKEAKEAIEATARTKQNDAATAEREQVDKAALGWSPITKLFAVLAAVLIVVNLYQALNPT